MRYAKGTKKQLLQIFARTAIVLLRNTDGGVISFSLETSKSRQLLALADGFSK